MLFYRGWSRKVTAAKTKIKMLREAEETGGGLKWGRRDVDVRNSRKPARLKWSEEEESVRKVGRGDGSGFDPARVAAILTSLPLQ